MFFILKQRVGTIHFIIVILKPGFHYTTNATTTTQKQSDYKVDKSSFTLIALFWLEIGRCRGRKWLKAWFPLHDKCDNHETKTKRL